LKDEMKSDQLELFFYSVTVETSWIQSAFRRAPVAPTWVEIVSVALKELGGEGYLKEINLLVERSPRTKKNVT
jgi:hypothetical protein